MNIGDTLKRLTEYIVDVISCDIIANNMSEDMSIGDNKINAIVNVTNNIVTANCTNINVGESIGKIANFIFDISMIYLINDNKISNISVKLTNIKSVDTYDIYISDIMSSILLSIFGHTLHVYINGIYDRLSDGKEIEMVDDIEIDIIIDNSDYKSISIMTMFLNTSPMKYNVSITDDAILTVAKLSSTLGESVKNFIDNNNKIIEDMSIFDGYINIDVTEFDKIFITKEDDTMLRKIMVSTINRSGQASVVDILSVLEGYGVTLNSVEFIVKLED